MKDVWELVVAGSTLADGDFWEHLNNQGGSGGGAVVFIEGFQVEQEDNVADIFIEEDANLILRESESLIVQDDSEKFIVEEEEND